MRQDSTVGGAVVEWVAMMRGRVVTACVLLAVGGMCYVLINNSTRATHMHFSTDGGLLENVVYYSSAPPEAASQHECDGTFADMPDHLYPTQVIQWREKHSGR